MNRPASFAARAALVSVAVLAACGPSEPAQSPTAASEPAAASAAPSDKSSAPEAPKAAPAESSPSETLARDLVKSGGRRIAWSATKKRFIVPVDTHSDGGRGLDLVVYDDEGSQRDIQRVCQPGECEEHLDEIAKELIPKLAARLDSEGFEAVHAVGWPSGRDELDVGSLGVKLRFDHGRISAVRDKKPAGLRPLGRSPKSAPSAVYPVPGAKLLGAIVEGEKGFYLFKLP